MHLTSGETGIIGFISGAVSMLGASAIQAYVARHDQKARSQESEAARRAQLFDVREERAEQHGTALRNRQREMLMTLQEEVLRLTRLSIETHWEFEGLREMGENERVSEKFRDDSNARRTERLELQRSVHVKCQRLLDGGARDAIQRVLDTASRLSPEMTKIGSSAWYQELAPIVSECDSQVGRVLRDLDEKELARDRELIDEVQELADGTN